MKVLLGLITIVLVLHLVAHIFIFGSGIPGFFAKGAQTLVFGKYLFDFVLIRASYSYLFLPSISAISLELLVVLFLSLVLLFTKVREKKVAEFIRLKDSAGSRARTELDVLYELLKQKKRILLSDVSKVFNVSEEIVLEWGRILESGDLAKIVYPSMGKPELRIEGSKVEVEENEN